MGKLTVGVIGAGYWGKKHVYEYLSLGCKVIAADILEENRESCKKEFDVEVASDYCDLLKDKEVKVVSICVPNRLHYKIATDCLNAGKHVLVEKPMAFEIEEALKLIELAKKMQRVLVLGHIYRFNNAVLKVKSMINNKDIGEVRLIKIKWTNDEYSYQPDFFKRVGDRDVLWDLAPHAFDIVNFLTGKDLKNIFCTGKDYSIKGKTDCVFINGSVDDIQIMIELSWITPPKTRLLEVIGSKKSVSVKCVSQEIDVFDNGRTEKLDIKANNTIKTELKAFIDYATGKIKSHVGADEIGPKVIQLIKFAEKSLKDRKMVEIPKLGK